MYLDVGDGHQVYYKEYGSPTGKPVVVLHGGPGGSCSSSKGVLRYFNLKRWRVIMFDQRGCGLSTPFLGLHKNTTWDLVADIEKLRRTCSIDRWTVFGGSWGSTLALAYASKHMDRIAALLIRGVCLMEPWETDWLYKEGGASRLFPEAWTKFTSKFTSGVKSKVKGNLTRAYSRLLRNRKTRKSAAAAWWTWEASLSSLVPRPDKTGPKTRLALAVLENHYFLHNAWLKPGELISAAKRIPASVPVIIIQGRYDMVCPAASAVAVANAVKHAELHMTIAGHAGADPENAAAIKGALVKLSEVSPR